jgi:hypothetical protein
MKQPSTPIPFTGFCNAAFIRVNAIALAVSLFAGHTAQASAQSTVFVDDFSDNNRDGWYLFNQGFDVDTRFLNASSGFMQTVSSDEILQ